MARFSDPQVVEEEFEEVLPRVHERWRAEDEAESDEDVDQFG